MLKELLGKEVEIHLGTIAGVTDKVKGEVIDVNDIWLKLKGKKKTNVINTKKIIRISF